MVGQQTLRLALAAMGMVAALTGVAGQQYTVAAKACTMRAAAALPTVAGLTVVSTSTSEHTVRRNKSSTAEMRVEITINAATVTATYAFECLILTDGTVHVVSAGIVR